MADCSRMLGQRYMEELVPVYIQRAIHTCVDITNPGSHRSKTDADVKDGNAPYLIRSLIYNMLDILYWCKDLPIKSMRNVTIRRVEMTKTKYEKEHPKKFNYEENLHT